jgi:adenine-specific DNA-methyltransferase
MTSVFIGGSRAVARLNTTILSKLDELIDRECLIVVGDANGADKAVQQHFAYRGYKHVLVYCMDACRNNIGHWPTRNVTSPSSRRDFAYYAAKDHAMAQDAKCGIMLWDGKSKGTLNNIQALLRGGKKTLVYLAADKTFHKIVTGQDLDTLLERCDPAAVQLAQQAISAKLTAQLPLHAPPG